MERWYCSLYRVSTLLQSVQHYFVLCPLPYDTLSSAEGQANHKLNGQVNSCSICSRVFVFVIATSFGNQQPVLIRVTDLLVL